MITATETRFRARCRDCKWESQFTWFDEDAAYSDLQDHLEDAHWPAGAVVEAVAR